MTGQKIATLPDNVGEWNLASFSPDGTRILITPTFKTSGGITRLWNVAQQQIIRLKGYQGKFRADGQRIFTVADNFAYVWNLNGQRIASVKLHKDEKIQDFSPDGNYILASAKDSTVSLLTLSGQRINVLKGHKSSDLYPDFHSVIAKFSPNGQYIITFARLRQDNTVRIWDLSGHQILVIQERHWPIVSFSPDGKHLATLAEHTGNFQDFNAKVRVWNLSGQQVAELRGHREKVMRITFSPDGQYIVTTSLDNTARIWDLTGRELAVLKHSGGVTNAAFSGDGRYLITQSGDGIAWIWKIETLSQLLDRGCAWVRDSFKDAHNAQEYDKEICSTARDQ